MMNSWLYINFLEMVLEAPFSVSVSRKIKILIEICILLMRNGCASQARYYSDQAPGTID